MLPTGINWKAADRAYREGYEEGLRALEQIRRGRGKKVEVGGKLSARLWDRLWDRTVKTRRTRELSERLWECVGRAA